MKHFTLPPSHRPYTDKYFLRANEVLKAERLNPWVTAQVFMRQPSKLYGINEAVAILQKYGKVLDKGGNIYALKERSYCLPSETVLLIKARIQDIMELETIYLGVISAETTLKNDKKDIDLKKIQSNMEAIVQQVSKRPVSYFGARHWRFDRDEEISRVAFAGGADSCSTDIGAQTVGKQGIGTIPHALQNIYAWKFGGERAVVESALAFDRVIDKKVPRVALVDYYNREIDDTLGTIQALKRSLYGIRIDTCGENVMEGCIYGGYNKTDDFWGQRGVSISGVMGLLDVIQTQRGGSPNIILSSGFANPEKVRAFVEAEQRSRLRLFDGLGVGAIFPGRFATMDIVEVGETPDQMIPISKVGREYRVNFRRLKKIT